MNEILQEKLERLAENEELLKALRKVFEQRIEKEKPEISDNLNNQTLGEKYRSYCYAKNILFEVLADIENCKTIKLNDENTNKGL